MNAEQPADDPGDGQAPARTVEDALKELRGLYRQRQAQQRVERRKTSDARLLERLQKQAARSRAAVDAASETGGAP